MSKTFLINVAESAIKHHETLKQQPVGVSKSHDELIAAVNSDLPDEGEAAELAIQKLISSTENGRINSTNPRYFGYVIGGAMPVAIAADWLTSIWDQNAQVYNTSPAASIIEEVVAKWILDLLNLPKEASVGFVTGAQMANFTALTVAKNATFQKHGWDITKNGLQGAPHINLICGAGCHATIHSAIRLMGLGNKNVKIVPANKEGRIDPFHFQKTLRDCTGPTIVCAQAGSVNSGSFDSFVDIASLAKGHGAWLHIDGAFGLWASTSIKFRHLVTGVEEADSWATDAHKWLNVPYDSGIVIIRDSPEHRKFKIAHCAYAGITDNNCRHSSQWVPENSRRARGFVLYAALRSLGRNGVRQIVENCCDLAKIFAIELSKLTSICVLNDVVLNQVIFRIQPPNVNDLDEFNKLVARRIQKAGVCWIGTTEWQKETALRISISNYLTTKNDVHLSIDSLRDSIDKELWLLKNMVKS